MVVTSVVFCVRSQSSNWSSTRAFCGAAPPFETLLIVSVIVLVITLVVSCIMWCGCDGDECGGCDGYDDGCDLDD
jgi:hypothetical protein